MESVENSIQRNEVSLGEYIANRYEVKEVLGKGGMGSVVRVVDHSLNEAEVALKVIFSHLVNDESLLIRFRNEVLIVRQLSHPNIVRLYDFGENGSESFYISMEYVAGENLNSLIRTNKSRRPDFQRCLRILYEIALGLDHAHSKGVVHRDVKPDNIIIAEDGSVKLTDFGLARWINTNKGLTNTGEAVGTPYYMAPEQIQGEIVDARADIYSFGILAYELVVGSRPFENSDWFQLAAMHLQQPMPKFATKENKIPKWFEDFVHVATAKRKDSRFQSFAEILAILVDKMEESPLPWKQLPSILASNTIRKRKSKIVTRTKRKIAQKISKHFAFGCALAAAIIAIQIVLNYLI